MTLLTKSAILAANDLKTQDVDVPEWGGAVRVRAFSGRERDAFEQAVKREPDRRADPADLPRRLVRCVAMTMTVIMTMTMLMPATTVGMLFVRVATASSRASRESPMPSPTAS